jgi:hypothetical protein
LTIFLLVAVLDRWSDIGILNAVIGDVNSPAGSLWGFRVPLSIAVLVHHLRVFFGLTYVDDRKREFNPMPAERRALERKLRIACAVTFPLFAIMLFDNSYLAIALVVATWLAQVVSILWYNHVFLNETVGSDLAKLVRFSDWCSLIFLSILLADPLIDRLLSHYTKIDSHGILGMILMVPFPIVVVITFLYETYKVYLRRMEENFKLVSRYWKGETLDAFEA